MGTQETDRERIVLQLDNRGRITIPKTVRERVGIEPGDEVVTHLEGSVLTVDLRPSENLQFATGGREEWTDSTPTDAGESLFGTKGGSDR